MRRSPRWSPDDWSTLLRLRAEGKRDVDIAVDLGRTHGAVRQAVYRLRERRPVPYKARRRRA